MVFDDRNREVDLYCWIVDAGLLDFLTGPVGGDMTCRTFVREDGN